MSTRTKEPFNYNTREEFSEKLLDWIGDVLYDILPEHGYQVREEQIYTAFQIADAIINKKVHLAEAGLGTGKTFAYLLSAIPYARFSGKPVVIACATTALQEQLAADEGDIATLSKLLGLEVDARMAKDPRQYVCDIKVEANMGECGEMSLEIEEWVAKTKLGERAEMPTIPDREWKKIGWDTSMDCETCLNRGYCKLVKAREHYRVTRDLIIVDHETFFHDLWTREQRMASGKLPILPSYSAVIFDEGHKILLPAAMQAGQSIAKEELERIAFSFEEIQGARDSLYTATIAMEQATNGFFNILNQSVVAREGMKRLPIRMSSTLLKVAAILRKTLDQLLLEMQIEQELYIESIPTSLIQAYEAQIERAIEALDRFCRNKGSDMISWVDPQDSSFWVVPRRLNEMLSSRLLDVGLPVVFTSATLSNKGNFDYFKRSIGLKGGATSSVGSPFDIERQVTVYLTKSMANREEKLTLGIKQLVGLLKKNGGRALVLTNSLAEVRRLRKRLEGYELPFELLWEDQGDRGYLVRKFREEETSVLIGANFWEGIDVPGRALTLVIVWQLPFPTGDPLLDVQRKEAKEQGLDPRFAVDLPEMGLKLKQGCGRLIRREDDKGNIVILDPVIDAPWEETVKGALPSGAKVRIF